MNCPCIVLEGNNCPKVNFITHISTIRLIIFMLTFAMMFLPLRAVAQQIRIMPLGDSITHGVTGSNPIGGFRDDLADLLLNEGINFDLVGTLNDGTNYYPYHEGHPGETAEYLADNIATWLNKTHPDIVLLHIGTNDINSYYANTDIRDDIERICENIWSFNINIPILLCSLIPRNDSFNDINTDLGRLVYELAVKKLAEGKLIRYVGQNEVWIADPNWRYGLLYDAFHPNNNGYHVMAEVYFNVVMNQITGISQFITDNFNRKKIGITWKFESPYIISSNKFTIQTIGSDWCKPAVYVGEMDPISVAFEWGSQLDPTLNGNAGVALHLQSYQTNTNGYLVYKDSQTKNIKLYLIGNGFVTQLTGEAAGRQDRPISGDQFQVSMYRDFQGQHFTCFINGNYDGDVIDTNNTYSSGDKHFAGIMLAGTANNMVDNFQLIHRKGPAERLYAVWGDDQQGKHGTRLADSLVVMVTDKHGNPISAVPVSFQVVEGDATLDPPDSRNHFEYEAEDGDITLPMQIITDATVSNGKYVEVPTEYPDDTDGKVIFNFTVAEEANFVVWGRVQSGDYLHDSFKVIIDDQSEIVWHISRNYDWTWNQVDINGGKDPVTFHLTAGAHTLKILKRECGSKLDKVIITSNLSFNPSTLNKPTEAYFITNASGRTHVIVHLGNTPGLVKIKANSPYFSDYAIFTETILSDQIPFSIITIDGNNQSGTPNSTLPKPLIVEVRDVENKSIPNIDVKFEITKGTGATLGNSQPVKTNDQGQASTTLTLGPDYGTYLVQANCPSYSISPVMFQATATNSVLSISGNCKYYKNNNPIHVVTIKMTGTTTTNSSSNGEGFYEVRGLEVGGNYTAIPERATFNNWSSHLITTYQAALTLRNAVGLESFTSSQNKAADVDKNGKVTSYDAALIAQFAVGLPRLTDSYIGQWIFLPAYRSYFDLNAGIQDQDYTGILLGDVTGDWNQSYGVEKEIATQAIDWLADIFVDSDQIINIPIRIKIAEGVLSWQLHLQFDPTKFQFLKIEKGSNTVNLKQIENCMAGNIYLGMYGAEAAHSSIPYATIKFRVLEPAQNRLELDVPYFQINNGQIQQGHIEKWLDSVPMTFTLLQNYPNPFNPKTTIIYQLPDLGQVKLVIYNLAGQKIVVLEDREKQAGTYHIEWNGLDQAGSSVTSGVYFCYLYYRDQIKYIKLVKVK